MELTSVGNVIYQNGRIKTMNKSKRNSKIYFCFENAGVNQMHINHFVASKQSETKQIRFCAYSDCNSCLQRRFVCLMRTSLSAKLDKISLEIAFSAILLISNHIIICPIRCRAQKRIFFFGLYVIVFRSKLLRLSTTCSPGGDDIESHKWSVAW